MKKFIQSHPIEILFSILFLTLAAVLNLQFLEGANVNFTFSGHDEYLTVREVYSILQPLSFKHFVMAIISGDVLYYGRIVFYIDALFAYIPYKIWGIEGMVYAIRMTHVIELLLGVLLLSSFIKNNIGKFFFIFNVLILYYTAYFVMVPKPEPLQLLLLAIFLIKAHKVNWQFGWHFVWLGLAYGAKFNILTVLPLFFILPYFTGYRKIGALIKSVAAFLIGIVIAIPCLLLTPIKPIFLLTYLRNTFGNSSNNDDTGVSLFTWVETGWLGAFNGGLWIGITIVAIVIWILFEGTRNYYKTKELELYFIANLLGLGLLLPVILFTERLWPHYLWTGHIFILLSVGLFLLKLFDIKFKSILLLLIITFGGIISITKQGKEIFYLESKVSEIVYNSKISQKYLKTQKDNFVVVQDLSVFYPFSEMLKINRYHPFASEKPVKIQEQNYMWHHLISFQIIKENKADFLLLSSFDFLDLNKKNVTIKDSVELKNKMLLKEQHNKIIFLDTTFGAVRVYRILNVN